MLLNQQKNHKQGDFKEIEQPPLSFTFREKAQV